VKKCKVFTVYSNKSKNALLEQLCGVSKKLLLTTAVCAFGISTTFAQVCIPPLAYFTFTTSNLTADFTDASLAASIQSWLWDFGDGDFDNTQNPSHTYTAAGTYLVCLTITDTCSSNVTFCDTVVVLAGSCPVPIAGFTFTASGLTANFTNTSTTTGTTSWFWDFGDALTDTVQNPSHTYLISGTYLVCLVVTDSCGTNTFCDSVVVTSGGCPVPVAGFTFTASGLAVNFTNTSTTTGTPSWAWTFGDGGFDNTQNPSHTYIAAGDYLVCLTVTDSCGTNTFCDSVAVTGGGCPLPSGFTFTTTNLTANFTDASTTTGTASWAWAFGDGGFDNTQNPSHTYLAAAIIWFV